MPTSTPQVPPRPAAYPASVESLQLFPRLTRARYKELYGVQAPPWDRTRQIQRWFDSSAGSGDGSTNVPYEITHYGKIEDRAVAMTTTIPSQMAATPNLPGAYDYPKYNPGVSGAYLAIPNGSKQVIAATELIAPTDVDALVESIKAAGFQVAGVAQTVIGQPFPLLYEIWEHRRLYTLTIRVGDNQPLRTLSLGRLYTLRQSAGMGAPGKWIPTADGAPEWQSEIGSDTGEQDFRPEIPIPCRSLLEDEYVDANGFGGTIRLCRVELFEPLYATKAELDEVKAAVKRIEDKLDSINPTAPKMAPPIANPSGAGV